MYEKKLQFTDFGEWRYKFLTGGCNKWRNHCRTCVVHIREKYDLHSVSDLLRTNHLGSGDSFYDGLRKRVALRCSCINGDILISPDNITFCLKLIIQFLFVFRRKMHNEGLKIFRVECTKR